MLFSRRNRNCGSACAEREWRFGPAVLTRWDDDQCEEYGTRFSIFGLRVFEHVLVKGEELACVLGVCLARIFDHSVRSLAAFGRTLAEIEAWGDGGEAYFALRLFGKFRPLVEVSKSEYGLTASILFRLDFYYDPEARRLRAQLRRKAEFAE